MMKSQKKAMSDFFQVEHKTDREHVLSNADMYMGSVHAEEAAMWIARWATVCVFRKKKARRSKKPAKEDGGDEEGDVDDGASAVASTVASAAESEKVVSEKGKGEDEAEKVMEERVVMSYETITLIPGLFKLVDEMLVNCRDHAVRMAHGVAQGVPNAVPVTYIRVYLDETTGELAFHNDGNAIDVVKVKVRMNDTAEEEEVWKPELTFTRLRSSTNFKDKTGVRKAENRIVGGKHGCGAKIAFIWSTRVTIDLVDHVRHLQYTQQFRDNIAVIEPPVVKASKRAKPFTHLTMLPDYARFGVTWTPGGAFEKQFAALVLRRTADIAAVTQARVFFNDKEIPVKRFAQYADLFASPGEEKEEEDAEGDNKEKPIAKVAGSFGPRWDVCLTPSPAGRFVQMSFVNGVHTSKGGKHVTHVMSQITERLVAACNRGSKAAVTADMVRDQLMLFLRCDIDDPDLEGQTKDTLMTPVKEFGSVCELTDAFVARVGKELGVIENARRLAEARAVGRAKSAVGATARRAANVFVEKLCDANYAGTARSSLCTLMLTEGDSAMASLRSGMTKEDQDTVGILPLGGKILNVRNESLDRVTRSKDLVNIMQAMGLTLGRAYTQEDVARCLRYGSVCIVTDQDYDGLHIRGLSINFFMHLWPSLLKVPRFLGYMNTPIIKAFLIGAIKAAAAAAAAAPSLTDAKKRKGKIAAAIVGAKDGVAGAEAWSDGAPEGEKWFYTEQAFEQWHAQLTSNQARAWRIKYYKGLGTSSAAEFKEYMRTRRIIWYTADDERDWDAMAMMFDKKRTDARKLVVGAAPSSAAVVASAAATATVTLPVYHFVHDEMSIFSRYNCERMIPGLLDGLKVGQRKILYAALRRNLTSEIKVCQLAAYVSEHIGYRHGEDSLNGAIIGMAQNFMSSNNIALLAANGQFGTRMFAGRDAASPRYIFTQLEHITRLIFPAADDAVLVYKKEEGQIVEPVHFVPVIPMLLVNGADGSIGSGYSSSCPPFSPRQIIRALRLLLADQTTEFRAMEFLPWYRGFLGTVEATSRHAFLCRGVMDVRADDNIVRVTELPPGTGCEDYKRFLRKFSAEFEESAAASEKRAAAGATPKAAAAAAKAKAAAAAKEAKEVAQAAKRVAREAKAAAKRARTGESNAQATADATADATNAQADAPATNAQADAPAPEEEDKDKGALAHLLRAKENNTDTTVEYTLTFAPGAPFFALPRDEQYKALQLDVYAHTSNLHAFSSTDKLTKYESVHEILLEFFATRLQTYARRKAHQLAVMDEEKLALEGKARFLDAIEAKHIDLIHTSTPDLVAFFEQHDYPRIEPAASASSASETEHTSSDTPKKRVATAPYEYLLSLNVRALTPDNRAKLLAKLDAARQERDALAATDIRTLWTRDLDAVQNALDTLM